MLLEKWVTGLDLILHLNCFISMDTPITSWYNFRKSIVNNFIVLQSSEVDKICNWKATFPYVTEKRDCNTMTCFRLGWTCECRALLKIDQIYDTIVDYLGLMCSSMLQLHFYTERLTLNFHLLRWFYDTTHSGLTEVYIAQKSADKYAF